MNKSFSIRFVSFGLLALLIGMLAGILITIQYLNPGFLKAFLPFNHLRAVHVSSVVSWIILSAVGSIYFYIEHDQNNKIFSKKLLQIHWYIYLFTGLAILWSLFSGYMGGREYLTFAPILIIPILAGWLLMSVNYFKTLLNQVKGWPVYYWMWGTGIVFMTYHLCESNFWIFSHFRHHFIRDLTVQWKSYGSFVGSWNQLVYGIAIYLMARLKGDEHIAKSKTVFFFYFLGLFNLMFGWAHHVYIVPNRPWIRMIAYAASMTEWLVLGSLILGWIRTFTKAEKQNNMLPFRFLVVTDIWIFLNVLLAIIISIPAINYYTHGTHITVAHSMGTTIGINTSILLSSIMFIVSRLDANCLRKRQKIISIGMLLFNLSLFVFLACLILAGLKKSDMMYHQEAVYFADMFKAITLYIWGFLIAGITLYISILLMTIPLFRILLRNCRS